MERDSTHCVLSQLLQSQVDILEKHLLELEADVMVLTVQMRELQWGVDKQTKPFEKHDTQIDKAIDSKPEMRENNGSDSNQLNSLHKQIRELQDRNVFLFEKLSEFEWDEETEKQIRLGMLQKRRERALMKVKLQYESKMKTDHLESPDRSDEDYGHDEID